LELRVFLEAGVEFGHSGDGEGFFDAEGVV
jgi:hypothetical protein